MFSISRDLSRAGSRTISPQQQKEGGGGTDIGNQPHVEPLTVERSQEAVGIAGLLEQLLELAVLYSLSLIRACLLGGNE